MKKLPDEKELKALVTMAKDFDVQIREQLEIARKIAIEYEKTMNRTTKQTKAQIDIN
jgi:hypothetical protein